MDIPNNLYNYKDDFEKLKIESYRLDIPNPRYQSVSLVITENPLNVIKKIFEEIEEDTDQIIPIYVNCWKVNTTYKIMIEICHQLGYRFTQNKKTTELIQIAINLMNKSSIVFAFDEIDKAEDFDFLYIILESVYRRTMFLLTNYSDWITSLDMRIRSRLVAESLNFKSYSKQEVNDILKERVDLGFYDGVYNSDSFEFVVDRAFLFKDIRRI